MFKSLRYRLLFWLLAFVLFTASFIIPLNYFIRQKEDKINIVVHEINDLNIQLLKLYKTSDNFLFSETSNPSFFITGKSNYLKIRQKLVHNIQKKADEIQNLGASQSFNIEEELKNITEEVENYNIIFDSLVYFIFKRGYKNFGLEGEMIDYANQLEKTHYVDKIKLLQIRRNEKDYFLRGDEFYFENFNRLTNSLLNSIKKNSYIANKDKYRIISQIKDYQSSFRTLINAENKIGLTSNSGLKYQLSQKYSIIEKNFSNLIDKTIKTQGGLLNELKIYYVIFTVFALLIAIVVSVFTSKYILSHLEKLTQYISKITEHRFNYYERLDLKNSATEINQIYREFRNMLAQLYVREKQRDKALKNAEENERRYRMLSDLLPQSIYETDELGNFTYVNKAWYKNFKYTNEDLKEGLNLIETVISESDDDILGNIKLENSNFVAIRKDSSRFPASVYSDNIIKDGKTIGKRGIIIDVTERNMYIKSLKTETYKAQTSDKLKSSFLANMSHEIRTPMNSIIGFSNLLSSEEIPDEEKIEFINYIKSSGEMLLNLIDDIIDIAKIEAGEIKINKKECDINRLFSELHKTFEEIKNKAGKYHIQLIPSPSQEEGFTIKTDPFRLRQILSNLLGNAIKFTDKGSIEFGYKLKNEKEIEFYVKDTGIGLSKEELAVIFERFKRSTQSEEKNIVGTGLGLSISKNLVELMKGEMWVDSKPGSGTTFFFILPYLKSTKIIEPETVGDMVYSFNWQGKTILVVEDNTQSYYFIRELLKRTGIYIERAINGFEAIDMCRNRNIDLVLMDIQLPKMNGYEATKEIKKINSAIPVIAQTAFAMEGDREKSILAGCDDYIPKPLNINSLLPKINQFISRKTDAPSIEKVKNQILDIPIKNTNGK